MSIGTRDRKAPRNRTLRGRDAAEKHAEVILEAIMCRKHYTSVVRDRLADYVVRVAGGVDRVAPIKGDDPSSKGGTAAQAKASERRLLKGKPP